MIRFLYRVIRAAWCGLDCNGTFLTTVETMHEQQYRQTIRDHIDGLTGGKFQYPDDFAAVVNDHYTRDVPVNEAAAAVVKHYDIKFGKQ